jgi:transposase-like protein
MGIRRLSDAEKQEILEIYRLPGETTSTLASRFGVSTSTINRVLKTGFSEAEYEVLIQQKKRGGSVADPVEPAEPAVGPNVPVVSQEQDVPAGVVTPANAVTPTVKRSRKRSSAVQETETETIMQESLFGEEVARPALQVVPENLSESYLPTQPGEALPEIAADLFDSTDKPNELEDDLDDDLDEDELDEDEDFEDDDLPEAPILVGHRDRQATVHVLPLEEALIPRTCYLVVDRFAELVARPLGEFGELGQIPDAETLEKTLPVFDNHRVAKRFSNPRTQRVIKLPDGKVLQKAAIHLQAKGITRLLIDGQVYTLN